jgi:DNA mismatch repair protein MutS
MGIVDEFLELKEDTKTDLLAMQVGDFYEFFGEDARRVSNEIGLKLSEKSAHNTSYPMAGVPTEDLEQYTQTLVEKKD